MHGMPFFPFFNRLRINNLISTTLGVPYRIQHMHGDGSTFNPTENYGQILAQVALQLIVSIYIIEEVS